MKEQVQKEERQSAEERTLYFPMGIIKLDNTTPRKRVQNFEDDEILWPMAIQ